MARPTKARINHGPNTKLIPGQWVEFQLKPDEGFEYLPGALNCNNSTRTCQIFIESVSSECSDEISQTFRGKTKLGIRVIGEYFTYNDSPGYGSIQLYDRPRNL